MILLFWLLPLGESLTYPRAEKGHIVPSCCFVCFLMLCPLVFVLIGLSLVAIVVHIDVHVLCFLLPVVLISGTVLLALGSRSSC